MEIKRLKIIKIVTPLLRSVIELERKVPSSKLPRVSKQSYTPFPDNETTRPFLNTVTIDVCTLSGFHHEHESERRFEPVPLKIKSIMLRIYLVNRLRSFHVLYVYSFHIWCVFNLFKTSREVVLNV